MTKGKPRSELFGEVLVQLDSTAREAAKTGSEAVEDYIREVLIPFVQKEQVFAEMMEEG